MELFLVDMSLKVISKRRRRLCAGIQTQKNMQTSLGAGRTQETAAHQAPIYLKTGEFMNTLTRTTLTAAILIAASASAFAAPISKEEYNAKKAEISNQTKASKAACKTLSGNAKDICMEDAKGQGNIARAELDDNYQPSVEGRYRIRIAKAEATYAVAKERCDDVSGNVKDVCRKEAKSAYIAAKADAKVVEVTIDANIAAQEKTAEVRQEAATDKRDAEFAVAKEKCDALASDAKANCVTQAKAAYGQK
jgi:hypothetical protein